MRTGEKHVFPATGIPFPELRKGGGGLSLSLSRCGGGITAIRGAMATSTAREGEENEER